jgi:hypothetical protein
VVAPRISRGNVVGFFELTLFYKFYPKKMEGLVLNTDFGENNDKIKWHHGIFREARPSVLSEKEGQYSI